MAAAGFVALVGGAGFGVCWAAARKLEDLAVLSWIANEPRAPAGRRPGLAGRLLLAALAAVGAEQERAAWLRRLSQVLHAHSARRWLGERDPGSAAWLACKELAFLVAMGLGSWLLEHWLLGVGCGALAFFVPDLFAHDWYERRQQQIRRELPEVLDLLTLAFEAGLSVDAGFQQVSEKYRGGILPDAITRMLGKIRFGARRHQAWQEMAMQLGNPQLTEVIGALVQADRMGVGLAAALKELAVQMRVRRRQQVEEAAHRAPVKLLFPLAFFIFPAIFIVLLGPVVLQMLVVFR